TSSKWNPPRLRNRSLADWSLATNRSTRPSPSRSAATTPRPRPSLSTTPASPVTSPNRPPALRKTWAGRAWTARARRATGAGAGDGGVGVGVAAEPRVVGVPLQVVAHIKVEVAVVVQVGEGRRRGPVAIAAQAGGARPVLEGPVPLVAVEGVGTPAGDEQVGA